MYSNQIIFGRFSISDVLNVTETRFRIHIRYIPLSKHWGRDKNVRYSTGDILKSIFLNEIIKLRLKFHWNLFLWVQFTICQRFRFNMIVDDILFAGALFLNFISALDTMTSCKRGCCGQWLIIYELKTHKGAILLNGVSHKFQLGA